MTYFPVTWKIVYHGGFEWLNFEKNLIIMRFG